MVLSEIFTFDSLVTACCKKRKGLDILKWGCVRQTPDEQDAPRTDDGSDDKSGEDNDE